MSETWGVRVGFVVLYLQVAHTPLCVDVGENGIVINAIHRITPDVIFLREPLYGLMMEHLHEAVAKRVFFRHQFIYHRYRDIGIDRFYWLHNGP